MVTLPFTYYVPQVLSALKGVKNYKALQSYYKYFTAGWILEHRWKCFTDCFLIVGKVNYSYALTSSLLQPWIIIKSTGTIVCGHYTCMAGLGETYSHVGAFLYWIEYQVRIYTDISSTSEPNLWIEPYTIMYVPYLHLEDINFTSAEQTMKNCKQLQQSSKPTLSKPVQHSKPNQADVTEFYLKCSSSQTLPI